MSSSAQQSAMPPGRALPRRILPRLDRREVAAVFAGGALGTLLRAALSESFPHSPTDWPWPTFVVNVVAALLLGYFVTRLQERLPISSYRRPLLGTGLCGGLSTFSTMQVELLKMIEAGAYGLALGYAAASHQARIRESVHQQHIQLEIIDHSRYPAKDAQPRPRLDHQDRLVVQYGKHQPKPMPRFVMVRDPCRQVP